MQDALICGGVRTPIGKYGGALRDVAVDVIAATVIDEALRRFSIPADRVDDVILGQCYPNAETPALGRVAALRAGLPVEVPGMQLDRRCGSGLQAVCLAAMQVQTGMADLVIAGGAESMSAAEFYTVDVRWGVARRPIQLFDALDRARATAGCESRYPIPGGMLETAENVRREYAISREDQDEYAVESHRRAVAAWESGLFADHVVAVPVAAERGGAEAFGRDEGPRATTSLEALQGLRPLRAGVDAEATVTAGNACGQSDAAAVCVVASPRAAAELELTPLAVLRSWAAAGVDPRLMGIGPVPATRRALQRAGVTLADVDLIELNEAFAVQVLACARDWDLDARDMSTRLNVNGGGISLGHPVGATGARILLDMLAAMRRRGGRYALETMCVGGGQGMAALFEMVA